jgi:hypothetical protein
MRRLALAISILLLAAASAGAAITKSFRQTTAKDFEEGEATGSMIMPSGDVVPGMKSTAITLDAAFVWCGATSPDGKVSYFGTGDQGRIYAVDAGSGGGRARLVATLEAAWVTALAVRPDGTLIAGTTPGGRVYAVKPDKGDKAGKSGQRGSAGKAVADVTKPFATLPAEHVWALALDNKTGTIYAATGGPGKVFAIDTAGKSRPLWDSGDKHVVSLIAADDRHLYAGTSEEAILYKVGLDGRAEALADFDAEEVRAIARHGTSVYAAINDFERSSSRRRRLGAARHARHGGPRRDRRRRRDRCRAPGSARRRRRSTASTPTGAWSRCSRSPTATSRRWRSTPTGAPMSAPAARAACTASPPIGPRRWPSTFPSDRRWRCCPRARAS